MDNRNFSYAIGFLWVDSTYILSSALQCVPIPEDWKNKYYCDNRKKNIITLIP